MATSGRSWYWHLAGASLLAMGGAIAFFGDWANAQINGGNITLQTQDWLLLRHGSQISATAGTAQAGGNGGNITINSPFIVAVPSEDSDISANAFTGKGGNIQVTASSIFGIQRRESDTPQSDITASSQFGINGAININTPDVDLRHGLVNLPVELVDASNSFATGCADGARQGQSEFIITGRGGLPTNPIEALGSNAVWQDLRPPTRLNANRFGSEVRRSSSEVQRTPYPSSPIEEATGWVINDKGEVVLTATAPTATFDIPWLPSSECNASSGPS
jgi:large exoprotein involved in heme utilization and adhesion